MKRFRARFTVCDLRVTIAQVNGWLERFGVFWRLEFRKKGRVCEVRKYTINESDGLRAKADVDIGEGSPRTCSLLCYKQFAYFASANCERKTEDSATAIHNRHAD